MSDLQSDFEKACNDPQSFDFGFQEQRRESGFANFGFDPAEAARLREEIDNYDDDDLWYLEDKV